MGLFSFFKKAGENIFNRDEAAAKAAAEAEAVVEAANARKANLLKGIVESMGIEIDDLNVSLSGDTVTIQGVAGSQSDKEKVILAMGNVDGVAAVDDRITVEVEEPVATFYEVQSGDTLSKIAKAHYGDAMRYMEIFEANKPALSDPNKIYPGQMLRIPANG